MNIYTQCEGALQCTFSDPIKSAVGPHMTNIYKALWGCI